MEKINRNGIEYVLQENGTATILRYTGRASHLTIPREIQGHTITAIAAGAFRDCHDLSEVCIPESITSIGTWAFQNCGKKTETVDKDLERAYSARCRRDLEWMFGYGYEYYEGRMMSGESPYKTTYSLQATVVRGSYAERYCKSNNIAYVYG